MDLNHFKKDIIFILNLKNILLNNNAVLIITFFVFSLIFYNFEINIFLTTNNLS